MKKAYRSVLTGVGALTLGLLLLEGGAKADAKFPSSCSAAKPVIGVALPNTVNPYYIAMQDSFKKNGDTLGFSVNVAIANDSDTNQLAQVEAFIQQGVCAVVLNAVNSGPGAASVKALNTAGIPVFTVNVIVSADDLKAQNASFVAGRGWDADRGTSVEGPRRQRHHRGRYCRRSGSDSNQSARQRVL
jgi:ribose transport system substrate-binding protein